MKTEVNSKRVKWATRGLDLTRHKFVFLIPEGAFLWQPIFVGSTHRTYSLDTGG